MRLFFGKKVKKREATSRRGESFERDRVGIEDDVLVERYATGIWPI
jgi:hypothetical protein